MGGTTNGRITDEALTAQSQGNAVSSLSLGERARVRAITAIETAAQAVLDARNESFAQDANNTLAVGTRLII